MQNLMGKFDFIGTTLILLPTDALSTYQQLTGSVVDQPTGLLSIEQSQISQLQSLFFNIGNVRASPFFFFS
jgi:hypothetical protein